MGIRKVKKVKMNIDAFYSDQEIELWFPENWDVTECRMAGHDKPSLSDDEMRSALQSPLGTPRLSQMAKGAKKVCILFDDIAKPTPVNRIIPFMLEELHEAGIAPEQIRLVCALGTHRPHTTAEFLVKLGREIAEKYPVFNHNIWENLVDVGQTSRGTPILVNREFASCDLRLGVGSIFPHPRSGFSGGGKIVMPGVAGMETIAYHHKNRTQNAEEGRVEDNVHRLDLEEAARLAGLHFMVNVVLNNRRGVVGLFAGDMVDSHRAAAKLGAQVYRTQMVYGVDVVVANSYPDEMQLIKTMGCVGRCVRAGGDVVLWDQGVEPQIVHQLGGRFGTDYGGRLFDSSRRPKLLEKSARIIIVSPCLTKAQKLDVGPAEKVIHCRNWAEALVELLSKNGPGTKVGVYPYAPMQLPEEAARWMLKEG
jgi:nickel-dependent lactate racemase